MTITRYEVQDDVYDHLHPAIAEVLTANTEGEYVKFVDVIAIIEAVYNDNKDFGSYDRDAGVSDMRYQIIEQLEGVVPIPEPMEVQCSCKGMPIQGAMCGYVACGGTICKAPNTYSCQFKLV